MHREAFCSYQLGVSQVGEEKLSELREALFSMHLWPSYGNIFT